MEDVEVWWMIKDGGRLSRMVDDDRGLLSRTVTDGGRWEMFKNGRGRSRMVDDGQGWLIKNG